MEKSVDGKICSRAVNTFTRKKTLRFETKHIFQRFLFNDFLFCFSTKKKKTNKHIFCNFLVTLRYSTDHLFTYLVLSQIVYRARKVHVSALSHRPVFQWRIKYRHHFVRFVYLTWNETLHKFI